MRNQLKYRHIFRNTSDSISTWPGLSKQPFSDKVLHIDTNIDRLCNTLSGVRHAADKTCLSFFPAIVLDDQATRHSERYRTVQEISGELIAHNIRLSPSEIGYLGRKFIIFLAAAHRRATPRIRQSMTMAGGYILHLDATHDGDAPALMTGIDSLSQFILANVKIPTEHADHIIPFLRTIEADYGVPLACVRDMGTGIGKAVATVFPGVHDFICHFHFLRDIGKVNELTTNFVEAYRQERLKQKALGKRLVRPATVNRETACLRHAFNLASQEELINEVPFRIKSLKEDNVRDRVLSDDKFRKLVGCCPPHLARIVVFAYYTAMRKGEILSLDWSEVDLDEGFIYLKGSKTKSGEGRMVPLNNEVVEMLRSMEGNRTGRVFTFNGKPLKNVKRAFATACRKAGIENFRFHDLRHTCINNWRLQGHDFFRIMAASGHKTMSVFKRYNTVLKSELRALVAPKMDTKKEKGLSRK